MWLLENSYLHLWLVFGAHFYVFYQATLVKLWNSVISIRHDKQNAFKSREWAHQYSSKSMYSETSEMEMFTVVLKSITGLCQGLPRLCQGGKQRADLKQRLLKGAGGTTARVKLEADSSNLLTHLLATHPPPTVSEKQGKLINSFPSFSPRLSHRTPEWGVPARVWLCCFFDPPSTAPDTLNSLFQDTKQEPPRVFACGLLSCGPSSLWYPGISLTFSLAQLSPYYRGCPEFHPPCHTLPMSTYIWLCFLPSCTNYHPR